MISFFPQVSPNDCVATTTPFLSRRKRVACDKRQKHLLGSLDPPHGRFITVIDSIGNSSPNSTSHQAVLSPDVTFVCEKVSDLPSTARLGTKFFNVDDWADDFPMATFLLEETTCTSKMAMFCPVRSSILTNEAMNHWHI